MRANVEGEAVDGGGLGGGYVFLPLGKELLVCETDLAVLVRDEEVVMGMGEYHVVGVHLTRHFHGERE